MSLKSLLIDCGRRKSAVRDRDCSHNVPLTCSPYSNCQQTLKQREMERERERACYGQFKYMPFVQLDLGKPRIRVLEIQLWPVRDARPCKINEIQLARVMSLSKHLWYGTSCYICLPAPLAVLSSLVCKPTIEFPKRPSVICALSNVPRRRRKLRQRVTFRHQAAQATLTRMAGH